MKTVGLRAEDHKLLQDSNLTVSAFTRKLGIWVY